MGWFNGVTPKASQIGQTQGKLMGNLKPQAMPNSKSTAYQQPHRRVSTTEMEDRRTKGFCFWCDEKYTFGHKCPNRRLYTLISEPMEGEEDQEEEITKVEVEEADPILSLHA